MNGIPCETCNHPCDHAQWGDTCCVCDREKGATFVLVPPCGRCDERMIAEKWGRLQGDVDALIEAQYEAGRWG